MKQKEAEDMENDATIAFKIPTALKDDFQRWCDQNAINMSEWFRQRVKTAVESGKPKTDKKERTQT